MKYTDTIDEFDLSGVVELSRNLYAVNQTVSDLYKEAMTKKLPCGYAWTTIRLTNNGWELQDITSDGCTGTKEGQALTGDVKKRVQDYATTHPQLVLDVLVDPFFEKPHQDKILNEWRDDKEDGVDIDHTKRTIEAMIYEDLESFQNHLPC